MEVQCGDVVKVGRETGSAAETLLGRIEVVTESDGQGAGVIVQSVGERARTRERLISLIMFMRMIFFLTCVSWLF